MRLKRNEIHKTTINSPKVTSPISLLLLSSTRSLPPSMSITMNSSGSSSNNSQESESNLNGLESYVEQTTQTHRVLNWVHTCPYCSKSFTSSQALGGHQNAHRRERFLLRRRSRRAWPCPRSHFPRSVRQVRQPPPPPRPVFLPWFGYGAPIKNVFRHNGCVYGVAGLPLQAINGVHALPRQLAPSFTYYHPPYPAVMEAPPTQRLLQEENLLGEGPCSESTETDPAIRDLIRNDNDVEVNKLDLTLRL